MNTWKTRGTVRREAEGEKQIKCHLEFPLTSGDTVDGILHREKDNEPLEICQAIKKENYFRSLYLWETEVFGGIQNLQPKSRTRRMGKSQSLRPMPHLL